MRGLCDAGKLFCIVRFEVCCLVNLVGSLWFCFTLSLVCFKPFRLLPGNVRLMVCLL